MQNEYNDSQDIQDGKFADKCYSHVVISRNFTANFILRNNPVYCMVLCKLTNENTGNLARLVNVPIWTLINILLIQFCTAKNEKHFSSPSGQFLLLLLFSNQPCLQRKQANSSGIVHSAAWILVPWLYKYVVCVHINSVLTLKAWILNTVVPFCGTYNLLLMNHKMVASKTEQRRKQCRYPL